MIALVFVLLAVCLLLGIPVGFSIGIATMSYLLIDGSIPLTIMAQKMYEGINSFPLLALPLFVLAGGIMLYGSTPRIMNLARMLLRRKRWGIGSAGLCACAAFGTISGSTVATTSAIGGIVMPEMTKMGYKRGFTAPLLAAGGVIGSIIPPSTGFVVYAQVAGVSISDMFIAGVVPGLILTICLCLLNRFFVVKNNWCAENKDNEYYGALSRKEKRKIIRDAVPPLLMPLFVLGGVLGGFVTPTEAATVACVYALFLGFFVYREFKWKEFLKVFTDSSVTSAVILFIISTATVFAWLLTTKNIHTLCAEFILSISNNLFVVYGFIILFLVILGTFMEGLSIILLTTPIFLPLLTALGVDPIAYGIASGLAVGIGTVTPPLAVSLFTACKIVNIRVEDTFPHVLYVCGTMLIATIICTVFPQLCLFLVRLT